MTHSRCGRGTPRKARNEHFPTKDTRVLHRLVQMRPISRGQDLVCSCSEFNAESLVQENLPAIRKIRVRTSQSKYEIGVGLRGVTGK